MTHPCLLQAAPCPLVPPASTPCPEKKIEKNRKKKGPASDTDEHRHQTDRDRDRDRDRHTDARAHTQWHIDTADTL